ncbi:hypothetical protein CWE08_05890 [Aliidiomarina iranensis]|uniref:tRNA 5-methylaminomethyl-2-thiouridine biosynthesis bifunctional protein MnmC n=1 Tax=Aliidiomarina iranensis TaxID=1434071 RepID=A0A432VWQ0_9GAMM|nr:FAD-dependent 5-carboxymethylaminomethyl-2-thiouridine(34) oxidoreductase MnmC [Aliidiomarina iranensis]RUO21121.1 hypothetical protein CWE08_05890 [Aliidiomarina iranensis]
MTSANANPSLHYADIEFDQQGIPESTLFADIYFSRKDGIAESNYVFIQHNDLHKRFAAISEYDSFVIAETGFGTGLNFLLAADLFLQKAPKNAHLYFTSFEKYPIRHADLVKIHQHWPQFSTLSSLLLARYPALLPGLQRIEIHPQITLDLYFSDVNDTLREWAEEHPRTVNAWFLDGFAPSKNPQMWDSKLFNAIALSLANHATFATFSATGNVRRQMLEAGLNVKKAKGFGRKREMLFGGIQKMGKPAQPAAQSIAIIGDGIAAATLAYELRNSNKRIHIFAAAEAAAAGASGNPQGAVYPLLQAQWTPSSDFYSHAHEFARQLYRSAVPNCWHESGVQQLSKSTPQLLKIRSIRSLNLYPDPYWQPQTQAQASVKANVPLPTPAVLLPTAGWVPAKQLVNELLEKVASHRKQSNLEFSVHFSCQILDIQALNACSSASSHQQWQLLLESTSKDFVAENLCFDQVIIAGGEKSTQLLPQALVPIRPVRGQITQLAVPDNHQLANLNQVLCGGGYITPVHQGLCCIGATFDKTRTDAIIDPNDDEQNLRQLRDDFSFSAPQSWVVANRASVRATTPDHLPLAGRVPKFVNGQLQEYSNLWLLSGLGARGLTSAPLAAALVAAQVENRPLPVTARINAALKPIRFAERARLRNKSIWVY